MRYITRAGILCIHRLVCRKFSTAVGKLDSGKIDLVLEKLTLAPFGSKEKYDTVYKKAVCLLEGFCRGHVFADGNKRTALVAAH